MTSAVRELDFLVRDTASLQWQGKFLVVDVPGSIASDPQRVVNETLARLRASVDERRSELLYGQVTMVFVGLGRLFDVGVSVKMPAAFKEKWIEQISAYGITASYQCAAELYVSIDWNRAYQHVVAAEGGIIPQARHVDLALSAMFIAREFRDYVSRNNLSVILDAKYVHGVDHDWANRQLGLPNTNIGVLRWVGRLPTARVFRPPELDELAVGIRLT